MITNPNWFRVVGYGLSGSAKKTPNEAWRSFYRAARRAGWEEHDFLSAVAATSAMIVGGTTRRAVEDADVSRTSGTVGKGKWEALRETTKRYHFGSIIL